VKKHKPTPLFPGDVAIKSIERGVFDLKLEPEHASITGINWHVAPAWRFPPASIEVECRIDIRAYPASGALRDLPMLHMELFTTFVVPHLEDDKYSDRIILHPLFLSLFAETALSTARGIITARCLGTVIEKFPIPYRDGDAAAPPSLEE